ncbi:MAG: CoA pyrophosphatase [Xanthomonadales bacterium]|nr:CoA pyrophosphatase [Xanthomonadales bacterium]
MPTELHHHLLNAVSPFDQGVAALKLNALRNPNQNRTRPKRTAAVLVPILDKPEPEVILTVRSELLPHHPGQVSFPGGSVDQSDRSAISTALREAQEEIGLDFSQVSPIGFLDRLDTISDYRVLPVVGLVKSSFVWQPDKREVSEVFTVPLSIAIDHSRFTHKDVEYLGKSVTISSLNWQGHKIWGVTAAILLNLGSRLEEISALGD